MKNLRIIILDEPEPVGGGGPAPRGPSALSTLDLRQLEGLDGAATAALLRRHAVSLPCVDTQAGELQDPGESHEHEAVLAQALQAQRHLGGPMMVLLQSSDGTTAPMPLDPLERLKPLTPPPSRPQAELDEAMVASRRRDAALSDPITGLPSRELMLDRLEQACAAVSRGAAPFSLLWIRLEPRPTGHGSAAPATLDPLLVEATAHHLQSIGRRSDSYARMGSQSFAGLLPGNGSVTGAITLAQRMADALCLQAEQTGGHWPVQPLEVHVGVALCPQHGQDAMLLLRQAHAGMEQARRNQQRVALFDPRRP